MPRRLPLMRVWTWRMCRSTAYWSWRLGSRWPRPNYPVVNFFDAGVGPLSAYATANVDGMNLAAYSDGRYSYQLTLFVARFEKKTEVTVIFPKNPIARESVTRYLEALKSACARVAARRGAVPLRNFAQT